MILLGGPQRPWSGAPISLRSCRCILLGVTLVFPSCGPSTGPLTVQVRDAATLEPAAGVNVVGQTPSRDHPFSIATMLGQTGPNSSSAVTDAQGRATITYIPGRPVRLGLLGEGWDPSIVLIDPSDPAFDAAAWQSCGAPVRRPVRLGEFKVIPEQPSR